METQNLYLIELSNENESFYKIGTSVHRYCRFYQIMKFGYKCTIKFMLMGLNCHVAMNTESYLHGLFKPYNPKVKFGGYTECYKNINLDEFKSKIGHLIPQSKEIIENLEVSWR